MQSPIKCFFFSISSFQGHQTAKKRKTLDFLSLFTLQLNIDLLFVGVSSLSAPVHSPTSFQKPADKNKATYSQRSAKRELRVALNPYRRGFKSPSLKTEGEQALDVAVTRHLRDAVQMNQLAELPVGAFDRAVSAQCCTANRFLKVEQHL